MYIIAGLIILLFLVGLFIDPIARNLLEKQVAKAAEGQYTLALDELDISILGGDVQLNGVRLETDSTHSEAPPIVFLQADEISLEDISWLNYLLNQKLEVDRVFLGNINIELFAKTVEQQEPDTAAQPGPFELEQLDIYPAIKNQIDRFYLQDLGLANISLTLVNRTTQDTLRFKAGELNFQSDNILVDADKLITDSRAFYSTAINLKSTDIEVERSGNKRMAAEAELVEFVTEEDLMSLQTRAIQLLRETLAGEDTLLFASLGEFQLQALDLNQVQEENTAAIESISLNQLELVNKMPPPPDSATPAADTTSSKLAELSFGEFLPELIERVKVGELSIQNVSVRQGDSIRIEGAGFQAQDIRIDEETAFADQRFLYAASVESQVDRLSASFGDPAIQLLVSDFRMNIEEGSGRLSIQQIRAEVEEKQQGALWFEAELGPLALTGINTTKLVEGQLAIDSIGVGTPQLVLNLPEAAAGGEGTAGPENRGGEAEEFTPPSLYPFIQPFLEQLYLRKVAVTETDIKLEGEERNTYRLLIPALYLQLRDIFIAEGTAYEDGRVLHTEDIALRVENISYPMPDSIYAARLALFRMSTFEKFIEADNFRLDFTGEAPELTREEELAMVYRLSNKALRVSGIQFSRMIQEQGVFIESVKVAGLEAYVYQNGNNTEPQAADTGQTVGMPQQLIRELDMPVYLGSLELAPGQIIYEQLASGADTAGMLEVTDFFVRAENVTNLQGRLRREPEIKLAAGGKIYGTGAFQTQLAIHMHSDSSLVEISGRVDTLDLTELNQLAVYTTPLAFSRGQLYLMDWEIMADEENATGTLELMYENVNIRLGESSGSDTTGIFKDIGSFLINNLALEEDVPAENPEEPETAEISHERNKGKGFVSYYISSLVDGLTDIVITIF